MSIIDELRAFEVPEASLSLWVFKKSAGVDHVPSFNGRWVETTDELEVAVKEVVSNERSLIEEVQEYSLLAQNNEGSALSIGTLETNAGLVVHEAAAETAQRQAALLRHLQNSSFYVIKLTIDETIIHAVSKTDTTWRSKKARTRISAFFKDQQLDLDNTPAFDISKRIDFFIIGDTILIRNKANFESILSYKQAHKDDFVALQAEPEFVAVFSDLSALLGHVGDNKIQLRRASAIRQKGHYRNGEFMSNLRKRHAEFGLKLQFDAAGKIVPTPETCRDIFVALLDHRLASGFSANVYDVPDATRIAV